MLSRTAASLYWLGRYVERADFIARLVEATLRLDVLSTRPAGEDAWRSALAVTETEPAFAAVGGELTTENDPDHEAVDVAWVKIDDLGRRLSFPNERRIADIAREFIIHQL